MKIASSRWFVPVVLCSVAALATAATQWNLQKESTVSFIAKQAGADFEGVFEKVSGEVVFDPKDLANSKFDIRIDMNSVNSKDAERDSELKTPALFNTKQFPTARYVTETLTDKGGGKFTATGKLTLRNVTRDTPIEFTYEEKGGGATIRGTSSIKRLDFGVGQGEWADTSQVPNDVRVRFSLIVKK